MIVTMMMMMMMKVMMMIFLANDHHHHHHVQLTMKMMNAHKACIFEDWGKNETMIMMAVYSFFAKWLVIQVAKAYFHHFGCCGGSRYKYGCSCRCSYCAGTSCPNKQTTQYTCFAPVFHVLLLFVLG